MEIATRHLGRMPYDEAWRLQLELLEARAEERIADTLLVVEHPPVITYGRKSPEGKNSSQLNEIQGVQVFAVERGGEATFHGPGQLVMYPIFLLNGKMGPKALLRMLENAIIKTLADYAVKAYWIEGKTGVWLMDKQGQERKIASLGIAVRKSVSYHGIALNIHTHLPSFGLIQPCGFAPEVMVNLQDIVGHEINFRQITQHLEDHVKQGFIELKKEFL